jgi:hypothetical protein
VGASRTQIVSGAPSPTRISPAYITTQSSLSRIFYRGNIPLHPVEDVPRSDELGTDCSLYSEVEGDAYDAVAYAEAMRWAQEKEAEVRAHEHKLQLDLQVGESIPVGSPRGRWESDV